MTEIIIQLVVIVILIILSAFFSSSETALTSIPSHRVRTMLDEGVKKAPVLDKVLQNKEKMLSTILIGNNIVNLTASALVTVVVQKLWGSKWVSAGTGVLTLLVLIFGEIAPKTMATVRAEKISLKFCSLINALMVVFTPITAAINFLTRGVLVLFGFKKGEKGEGLTENEFRTLVEVGHEEGVIENDEKEMINNVFDFSDTIVREVMVPKINVCGIGIDASYEEVMAVFKTNYFTRMAVFDDSEEKILGFVNVKDLAFNDQEQINSFNVRNCMREAEYTFEQKHLSELFLEMKKNNTAIMVVLDEYGDTAGIVTLEDLLEELVGDIRDEYDDYEAEEIVCLAENEYLIQGHVSLDDVNDRIGSSLESEDYDSIGGLLIELLGRIPEEGDEVTVPECGIILSAQKVAQTRIEQVRLVIPD